MSSDMFCSFLAALCLGAPPVRSPQRRSTKLEARHLHAGGSTHNARIRVGQRGRGLRHTNPDSETMGNLTTQRPGVPKLGPREGPPPIEFIRHPPGHTRHIARRTRPTHKGTVDAPHVSLRAQPIHRVLPRDRAPAGYDRSLRANTPPDAQQRPLADEPVGPRRSIAGLTSPAASWRRRWRATKQDARNEAPKLLWLRRTRWCCTSPRHTRGDRTHCCSAIHHESKLGHMRQQTPENETLLARDVNPCLVLRGRETDVNMDTKTTSWQLSVAAMFGLPLSRHGATEGVVLPTQHMPVMKLAETFWATWVSGKPVLV